MLAELDGKGSARVQGAHRDECGGRQIHQDVVLVLEDMNGGHSVRALLTLIARFAGYGSAMFLAAMMLITVADVVLRALFNLPITGAYDLVQLFLVGTVFLSIPDVFLHDENIVIDFVDHMFGRTFVGLLKMVASLAALVFLSCCPGKCFAPALDAMRFGEVSPDLVDSDDGALDL